MPVYAGLYSPLPRKNHAYRELIKTKDKKLVEVDQSFSAPADSCGILLFKHT